MPVLLAKEMSNALTAFDSEGRGKVLLLVMTRKYDLTSKTSVWRKQICVGAGKAGAGKGWVSLLQQKEREANLHENLA